MPKDQPDISNVPSELWAEAMANYVTDTGLVDRAKAIVRRARDRRKKNQEKYAEEGIPADMIAKFYDEDQMDEGERIALYAMEQTGRRALDLWNAATPADFNRLMTRAAKTQPAWGDGSSLLDVARAKVAGFNGTMHGGQTDRDNPHAPGTEKHVAWAKGYADAMTEMGQVEKFLAGEPSEVAAQPEPDPPTPPKASRKTSRKLPADLAPDTAASVAKGIAEDVAAELGDKPGLFADGAPTILQ